MDVVISHSQEGLKPELADPPPDDIFPAAFEGVHDG
jgi:hypothetical protein